MTPSVFKSYGRDQLEEHFSNYIINSWSYSKVTTFSRNEKAFEMIYIFGISSKFSSTTVAGQAYHAALQYFFDKMQAGEIISLPIAEAEAFAYIDNFEANRWKIQKTVPTVEECIKKATLLVTELLRNFYAEMDVCTEEISKVLDVEVYCDEFITVNGVDIPLPCHCKIDLVIKTTADKTVIIDHKSKHIYTPDDEMALSIGVQAMTYVLAYESKTGTHIDEVWFIENKSSTNKDKSPQLRKFIVSLSDDTRRLYEALLYEPLKRLIGAVSDPDYVYLINNSDNFVDRAELYDFWARTMICEVEDFNVVDAKKELVARRLKKIRDASIGTINPKIIRQFKDNASKFIQYDLSTANMTKPEKIEHLLRSFGISVHVAHELEGFSFNTYLLEVSAGTKIASIHSHRLDLANALDVSNVRISNQLFVYEEKSYLGVELSKKRDKDLPFDDTELLGRKIPIGRNNLNQTVYWDWDNHSTPHVLVCGATGSGKSVCLKSTMEFGLLAGVDELVILDPKHEFSSFRSKKHTSVYSEIEQIERKMADLVEEMNRLVKGGKTKTTLVVFDEFADALAQSRSGNDLKVYDDLIVGAYANGTPRYKRQHIDTLKSLDENLRILLQKGRSSGYRIMAATQRASVKVINGDTKVNFPVQICFRVPKEQDSRVVIDEAGAESLAGMGDGLMKSPEYHDTVRFQAFYKN